jgi:hypothetical protein
MASLSVNSKQNSQPV